ncbi:hypothetical protein XF_0974 [Xylella fastidiosa 9a5c]|uniref:Uncharacterized protein n=1 Tax=Xylella fastidiosa (strain 9a5c) TaxID=160492 RepID=Q9PEQ4_XYLFA|nr:hypothetical protein XF_0974 [Xylella fastidiosa 9a5c]
MYVGTEVSVAVSVIVLLVLFACGQCHAAVVNGGMVAVWGVRCVRSSVGLFGMVLIFLFVELCPVPAPPANAMMFSRQWL